MSLYIGKNNNDVNILHMTRGNTPKEAIQGGLVHNTVYHSEYPFFEFLDVQIYTMPSSRYGPGNFVIPSDMLGRILNGAMFGVFCSYNDQNFFEQLVYSLDEEDSDGSTDKYSLHSPGFRIPNSSTPPYYGRETLAFPKNMSYNQLYIEQSWRQPSAGKITKVMFFTYGAKDNFTGTSIHIDRHDVNIKGRSLKNIKKLITDEGNYIEGAVKIKTHSGKYFWVTNVFKTITDTIELSSNSTETYIKAGNIPLLTTSPGMHNGNVIKSGTVIVPPGTFSFPWNSSGSTKYTSPAITAPSQVPDNALYNVWLRSFGSRDMGGLLLASFTGQPSAGYVLFEEFRSYYQDMEERGFSTIAFKVRINSQLQFELTYTWTVNWMNPGYYNDLYLDYELVV